MITLRMSLRMRMISETTILRGMRVARGIVDCDRLREAACPVSLDLGATKGGRSRSLCFLLYTVVDTGATGVGNVTHYPPRGRGG